MINIKRLASSFKIIRIKLRQKFRKTYGFPDGPERPPLEIPLGTPPVSLALGCGSWGGPPPTGGPPVGAPT